MIASIAPSVKIETIKPGFRPSVSRDHHKTTAQRAGKERLKAGKDARTSVTTQLTITDLWGAAGRSREQHSKGVRKAVRGAALNREQRTERISSESGHTRRPEAIANHGLPSDEPNPGRD